MEKPVEKSKEVAEDAEILVGITCFLHNSHPVNFTYKYRYTDFVVHEIALNNELVPFTPVNISGRGR